MKIRILSASTLGIALFGVMASTNAFAGDEGMSHDRMMKAMDSNGDGMVSAAEHAAWAKARFEKMDANHDGNVSKAEWDAGMQHMQNRRMKHKMKSDSMPSDRNKGTSPTDATKPADDGTKANDGT